MTVYEVTYESIRERTRHSEQREALDEFRQAVTQGVPVSVWEIPDGGGEARSGLYGCHAACQPD